MGARRKPAKSKSRRANDAKASIKESLNDLANELNAKGYVAKSRTYLYSNGQVSGRLDVQAKPGEDINELYQEIENGLTVNQPNTYINIGLDFQAEGMTGYEKDEVIWTNATTNYDKVFQDMRGVVVHGLIANATKQKGNVSIAKASIRLSWNEQGIIPARPSR